MDEDTSPVVMDSLVVHSVFTTDPEDSTTNRTKKGKKKFVKSLSGKTESITDACAESPDSETASPSKKVNCEICNRELFFNSYKAHMLIHLGIKNFKCHRCDMAFSRKETLHYHMQKHTGVKDFKCSDCGAEFTRKVHFQRHIKTHTGEREFKCEICGEKFPLKSELIKHIEDHSEEERKHNQCDICRKVFIKTYDWRNHIVIHDHQREKNYSCEICGAKFHRKPGSSHMAIHFGSKNFKCDKCDKSFLLKKDLMRHMKHHSGIKDHDCKECGKAFSSLYNLNRHYLIHTGSQIFQCDICEKQFTTKANLKRHIIGHKDVRKHRCKICDLEFKEEEDLRLHMETKNVHEKGTLFVENGLSGTDELAEESPVKIERDSDIDVKCEPDITFDDVKDIVKKEEASFDNE
ncbi:hypothetical protein SK128_024079 [Halocaridina rubra]|uniref:C2H2-type domain-containing protein n=1 Tax=Halocaridina rubra TaxID=373956 RepID=A0AAN8WEE4_HALRR